MFGGALLLGYYTVFTKPGVSYRSGFFGPAERILLAEGHDVELVPGGFRQFAPILARFAPRIMAAQAAPPDADGRVNLSLHFGATRDELLQAGRDPDRLLLVEINPHLPRTCSLPPRFDNTLPVELIDVLVEADGEPFVLDDPDPDRTRRGDRRARAAIRDRRQHVADGHRCGPEHGRDQVGRGRRAAGTACTRRCSPPVSMRLHQAGKVTNDAKGVFDGVSVTTFALGTAELYRWLDGNADVAFLPVDVVNDPSVIGSNHKLRVDQRRAVPRPLRTGRRRQHRRQADLRCRRARRLRRRRRAPCSTTHSLICLLVHGDRRRCAALPHPPGAAGRRHRLDATPPHRRRRHRVRSRGAHRAHRPRTSQRARRHRPSRLPRRAPRHRESNGAAVDPGSHAPGLGEHGRLRRMVW